MMNKIQPGLEFRI